MYFLRWLYREVNPMILVLGLALLYFLLNGMFGSASEPEVDLSSQSVVSAPNEAAKDKVVDGVENSDSQKSQDTVVADSSDQPTDFEVDVQDGAAAEIAVHADSNEEEQVAEAIDANEVASSSIFSRLFKKSAEEESDLAEPEVVASAATATAVVAAAPLIAGEQDAVDTEAAVVAADVVDANKSVAIVEPEQAPQEVEDVQVDVDVEDGVAETALAEPVEQDEPKKKGGFLGLFGGDKDQDDEAEAPAEKAAVEQAAVEPVLEESEAPTVAIADEATDVVAAEEQPAALPPAPAPVKIVSADMQKLAQARRAYWNREYAQADTLYNELMNSEPANADLIAEYGNMLLQSGQVEKTLNVYEKAAGLMIESGRKQDAKPLIDYISSWDKDRGDQLINRVFAQ